MKLALAESINRNTVGANEEAVPAFLAITSGSTVMPTARWSRWPENHVFWSCHLATQCVWMCFSKSCQSNIRKTWFCCACDGAAWHKSQSLQVPENIELFYIPPYTPEMNPIEQIWKELRKLGFRNEIFATLDKVIDRLCETICRLSSTLIRSITCRDWIAAIFN